MSDTFDIRPAVRERTPILVGLVGPSGSGKTFSALRLAAGIQRVVGGDICGVDTEARRMLHYADNFKFHHLAFGAPFSPSRYLAAIRACVARGAKTIIVDSTSHEHDGPGGVLEMHEQEVKRLSKGDPAKADRVKMLAWSKPKAERRRLINEILQMEANFIFCFRAKEKLKIERGKEPAPLGWMPIAGEEFVYEMTLKCLLLPGANGIPTWQSDYPGERTMMKLPEQFKGMFRGDTQLTEDLGQALASWAAGAAAPVRSSASDLLASYEACSDHATLRALEDARRVAWGSLSKADKLAVKSAADAAAKRVAEATFTEADGPDEEVPFANEADDAA